ncbi:tRNA (adenosine(37)-N6)-dimethylallyltransferase MiaA [Pseudahrensia aquimaris]|uniref:tRNA dimethylallyltransferase n=1 Tax=Pseudahrensia aquimaris TaxID=744461 RepID=A0ABW3FGP0_9HYPH
MPQLDAILIAGPTASGKSAFAVDLAERVDGEIINTDSMQVYPVLNVLTARPPKEDLERVPHHLYAHVDPRLSYSAAQWVQHAEAAFSDVTKRGRVPIFVGGTGLYFMALEEGLSAVPPIPEDVREGVRQELIDRGAPHMHAKLAQLDPAAAARLKPGDSHRIARTLEVVLAHGKPLASFHEDDQNSGFLSGKRLQKHLLMPPRSTLHKRIDQRAGAMLDGGAIDEVRALLALNLPRDATALRAIGVSAIGSYIRGEQSLSETENLLKTATRQYAKRQSTWFRNRLGEKWKVHGGQ